MKEKIIRIFKESGNQKLDPIMIVKHFKKNYEVKDIKEVINILNELVEEKVIVSTKKNTYKLVTDEYIKSKVEKVSSGNGWLLLEDGDIFIDKKNMNGANTNDLCLCETFRKRGSIEARVVKILERNLPLGEVKIEGKTTYIKPLKMYEKQIVLMENDEFNLIDGEIVKIKSVKEDKDNIYVVVTEKVGHKNSPDIDTLIVMKELDMPVGFSKETMEEVSKLPKEVLKEDYKGRTDLTKEIVFTIDGIDTKDIDDAVGLKILENGNYLLNVSIADVTHYVKYGSSTYKDAYNKGNSTYMADKVEPMLPVELSNGICSLNEGVERCAVTTLIEIDKSGNFVNKKLISSIIKSRKKMNYESVNKVLKGEVVEGYMEYASILKEMNKLSKILNKKRQEKGNIDFPSSEIKLLVDDLGKVTEIKKCEEGEGEKLIENFMILSNEASIDILTSVSDYAIFRVHGIPSAKKMEEFMAFLSNLGYTITGKITYSKVSNRDIQRILEEVKNTKDYEIIASRLLRSMQKAVYSTDNIGHFGLGSKKYTHETSPIRRMSDLLLHYLIKSEVFNIDIGIKIDTFAKNLREACEHISMTERRSDECEYEVNDLKIAEYMEKHIGEEYEAVVDGLTKNGFFVETSNYVSGFVSLDTMKDYLTLSEDMLYYTNRKKQIALKLGDKVKVRCIFASKENRHVDFMLI